MCNGLYCVIKCKCSLVLEKFSVCILVKQVLGSTYVELLVALAKIFTEMRLHSLSNVSLRSRNSKTSSVAAIANLAFLVLSILVT